jgi:predicted dehydrogenase
MKRVGVVGYGYWGPNLVRNFLSHPDFELVWICDSNPGSQERCRRDYHGVTVFGDLESALAASELDLVAVATPASYPSRARTSSYSRGRESPDGKAVDSRLNFRP